MSGSEIPDQGAAAVSLNKERALRQVNRGAQDEGEAGRMTFPSLGKRWGMGVRCGPGASQLVPVVGSVESAFLLSVGKD